MPVKQMTPSQANDLLHQDAAVIYLDVRTVPEFVNGHPQRGINIPAFFFQAPGQPVPNPELDKWTQETLERFGLGVGETERERA